MTSSHHPSVRDAIELLQAVKMALHDTTETAIVERVSEAIDVLHQVDERSPIDRAVIIEALRILGDGIALVPVVAQLIETLKQ